MLLNPPPAVNRRCSFISEVMPCSYPRDAEIKNGGGGGGRVKTVVMVVVVFW